MSQPQNLHADELQHPTPFSTLTAVPQPAPSSDDLVGPVSVATPRLRAVAGESANHTVPATVRYADSMIDGALALRLQAITRLGVVSSPTTLTSLAAFTSAPAQAPQASPDTAAAEQLTIPDAAVAPESAPADAIPAQSTPVGRTLGAVPADGAAVAGGDESVAVEPGSAGDGSVASGRPRRLAAVPAEGTAGASAGGPAADGPAVPDAEAWASRLVQAVSEVLAGDRPISQLVRFTDEAVFTDLNRRVRMLGLTTTATTRGARDRSAVRSVRVCTPAWNVAEVAAHVRHGDRSRAIALRMEIRRHRWVCTALELG